MMTGRLYIDGDDAYAKYGVYVADGGYCSVIAWPPGKEPESNDWQEEDGAEADLEDGIRLDGRDVSLPLACARFTNGWSALLERLSDRQEHEFDFREIGRTYRMRLKDRPQAFSYLRGLALLTLRLTDDRPEACLPEEPREPFPVRPFPYDYVEMDNVPLMDTGFTVLDGSAADALEHSAVKTPLVRNVRGKDGQEADTDAPVTFKTRDVRITLHIRKPLAELWTDYDGLLLRMTRPGERSLDFALPADVLGCYYKSCSVSEFVPDGDRAWLKFTVTLAAVSGLRQFADRLLATEDGAWVILEDEPADTARGYVLLRENTLNNG